ARSANNAIQKILAVLPDHLRHSDENLPLLVPTVDDYQKIYTAHSQTIREAIRLQRQVIIDYVRADEEYSSRQIEPLGLIFWGKVWTLVAWCQLRNDYRVFRLERIRQLATTREIFETDENKSLKHYLNLMAEHYATPKDGRGQTGERELLQTYP